MSKDKKVWSHYITLEELQEHAFDKLDRELTKVEVEKVKATLAEYACDHIEEMIQESIEEVTSFDDLEIRNAGADTQETYYLLNWKNLNAFQQEYKQRFAAFTEDDIREYIQHINQPYDEYEIILIHNGVPTVIDVFGEKYTPSLGTAASVADGQLF